MFQEAMQWLKDNVKQFQTVERDGKLFANTTLFEVKHIDPLPGSIKLVSLAGLLLLIDQKFEGKAQEYADAILHVVDFQTVKLFGKYSDQEGRRLTLAEVSPVPTTGFKFGEFMDQETFIINVASKFADNDDKQRVIDIASGLTSGAIRTAEDDGLGQKVTVRRGVSLTREMKIDPFVNLAPFRTFPEISQPTSKFLLRLQQKEEEVPTLALFEADGGAWKLAAMQSIASLLRAQTTLPVVA